MRRSACIGQTDSGLTGDYWTVMADNGDGMTWMERLREAARSGEVLDLAPGLADDESEPPDIGGRASARELPAEDIRAVLLDPSLVGDPRGLRIRGAFVSGTLNLDYAKLLYRLEFTHCRFQKALSFEQTHLPELVLDEVVLPSLWLRTAQLAGNCTLTGLRTAGVVAVGHAHIGGRLILNKAKLNPPDGYALSLDGTHIGGFALLDGLESTGTVRFGGAHINGHLGLNEAKLSVPGGDALALDGADIAGSASMRGLEATGTLLFHGAHIGGELNLTGAKLNNPGGDALALDGAAFARGAFMNGLEATGKVRAHGTHIGGELNLTGAKLNNPGEDALSLDEVDIASGAFLRGLEATGSVRAHGAHIGGQVVLIGAKLSNPDGDALSLDGVDIPGDVFMERLEATGGVRARGARMGQLTLKGAKLSNPDGVALNLDEVDIPGDVFLERLETSGKVRASHARIGGLSLKGAKLSNPDGDALDLSSATLETFALDDAFTLKGRMNLSFVSIRFLSVGAKKSTKGLPPLSDAYGWTVGAVRGFLRTDRSSARDWLDTIDTLPRTGARKEFAAQPWKELAKIYDQIGQPEDGRRLRFWAARRTTQVAPWTSKLVRWPYAALVGYGYYPAIILGWLTALWISVIVLACLNAQAFTPTDFRASTVTVVNGNQSEQVRVTGATATPPNYPSFNAGLFAVDTAIPAAATGQATAWRITENTWLPGIFAGIKGFAWVLTALLLAGITGLLRKD